ncbi:MAG: hemerythrin domain-containing protein [Cytophagaceae bacterium]|nr:hemerythrin domain-containing protein [Cytophagaceae bacterium]
MDNIRQKRIDQIIHENYVNASALFFFGISFYNYSEKTLEQVCQEKSLDVNTVIRKLESSNASQDSDEISLNKYPLDLIIEYLKHTHHIFVKHKLPYITKLISQLDNGKIDKSAKDLKFIFPFFVEDFIKHIYEEEDTLFTYILTLHNSLHKKYNVSKLYFSMEKHSVREYALKHSTDDDEMEGIRKLTNNYSVENINDLHLKVIYLELKSFEENLRTHARIENEILFPKALALENEVNMLFKNRISSN